MNKLLLVLSAIAFVAILAIMFLTSPSEIGPLGIMIFFVLVYVLFVGLAVTCCRLFLLFRKKLDKSKGGNIKKKSYYYGIVLALAPVLLLVCGSFAGIRLQEILLVCALEVVLCFLVSRNIL